MSAMPCTLADLLPDVAGVPAAAVTGLALDGRHVVKGGAFVALAGGSRHGLDFLPQALARGAAIVLWEPAPGATEPSLPPQVSALAVEGLRARLGAMADRFFGEPSAAVAVTGITGTNGKTTCAWLLAQALAALGKRCAYAGTLGWGFPPSVTAGSHTTPDVLSVHRELAVMAAAGATHAAMEVSSHALQQGRVDGLRIRVAGFTNLSRDHLDYHGTMERYAEAKALLFARPGLEHAVINVGDSTGARIAATLPPTVALIAVVPPDTSWQGRGRRLVLRSAVPTPAGLALDVDGDFGAVQFTVPLVGDFNVENAAVVLGLLLALGHPLAAAAQSLSAVTPPPGRMETFRSGSAPLVIVDYAHTPDALAKVLRAARSHCSGRLVVVFGCGGDRDAGKRPLMGRVASDLADEVWLTDDNPRSEDGAAIILAIAAGLGNPASARVERDRAAAIAGAIASGRPGDVVVIAGKGHEDYQIVGDDVRPFSDVEQVRLQLGRAA